MIDYSKPIGWWCPECIVTPVLRGDGDVCALTHQAHCKVAEAVPVFDVIPEGDRPEAEEPDEGDVCTITYDDDAETAFVGVGRDDILQGRCVGRWAGPANGPGRNRWLYDGWEDIAAEPTSLAEAVLWVVERRGP